jgi:hypothetical protein
MNNMEAEQKASNPELLEKQEHKQTGNNEQQKHRKDKTTILLIPLVLAAVVFSVFTAWSSFNLYQKIDFDGHVVSVAELQGTQEEADEILEMLTAKMSIRPGKEKFTVSGGIVLTLGGVEQTPAEPDEALASKLQEWVNIAQPGTAGSSMKAVSAAKEMLSWAKESELEYESISSTIKKYFAENESADEAKEALSNIKNIFDNIADGSIETLLENEEVNIEEFEMDEKASGNIKSLFEAFEKMDETDIDGIHKAYFKLTKAGLYSIDYAIGESMCVIDDLVKVQLVTIDKVKNEGIYVLNVDDNSSMLVMSKKLSEETGLIATARANSKEEIELAQKITEEVYKTSYKANAEIKQTFVFDEMQIAPEWCNDYRMITSVIELSGTGNDKAYLSAFTGSITGAGMSSTVELVNGTKASYSTSIKDSATGYIPFIYSHEKGMVKILATSAEQIPNIFTTPEPAEVA